VKAGARVRVGLGEQQDLSGLSEAVLLTLVQHRVRSQVGGRGLALGVRTRPVSEVGRRGRSTKGKPSWAVRGKREKGSGPARDLAHKGFGDF
jgi:hypothetical protein